MKLNMFPFIAVMVSLAVPAVAAERHMMQPRVPADKLAEARALTSPLPNSPEIVEQGKALYNGKGHLLQLSWKRRRRQWAVGCPVESIASQFPAPWILAPSYGR